MQINKALITVAGPDQRNLALQTLVDKDGNRKTVLEILICEAHQVGIEEIGVVIQPSDADVYQKLVKVNPQVHFIIQDKMRGYGYAILCGADFIGHDYFLHLVGDHLVVNRSEKLAAQQLIEMAVKNESSVSAVTSTRESLITSFGTIGGHRIHPTHDLYQIDKVVEKPTPTLAEQKLIIPGLRAGHYLCFLGMHVLSPLVMDILKKQSAAVGDAKFGLSEALNELASHEQYLALERNDLRFDIGSRYGLLKAQLAIGLSGVDRDELMSDLLEFFAVQNADIR